MHGRRKIRETDVKSNANVGCESLRLSFGHAPASAAPIGALRDATVRHAYRHVKWTDRERRAVDVASTSACEPECPGVLHTRVLQPDRPLPGRAVFSRLIQPWRGSTARTVRHGRPYRLRTVPRWTA